MSQFTENEIETIRGGVMGAVALVSQAEPGFFATFKESMAASKALANAPQEFTELMKQGGMVMPPKAGSQEEMNTKLLENLRQAVQVASKDQPTLEALKSYVTAATQEVAGAAKGVSPEETAVIEQVNAVLNESGTAAPQAPAGQAPTTEAPASPTADGGQVSEAPANGGLQFPQA